MNNNHHYRFLIVTVFLVLAILTSILIYTQVVNSPIITGSQMTKASPMLTIKNSDETTRHPLTDYLKLEVLADSNQVDVVGYDCIVGFDTTAFEIIQADSDLPDFNLYKIQSENKLTITGVKKLNTSGVNKLNNSKIMTLTLKPLKTGKFSFKLISEIGKEKTQLVDTGSNVYYPKLNNIEIEIY